MSAFPFELAVTTLEKLEDIPHIFWLKLAGGIIAFVVAVALLKKLFSINKFILGGAMFIAFGCVFFNWLYYRTEPKFLSPIFTRIAPFFPTAGAYETKQATNPK